GEAPGGRILKSLRERDEAPTGISHAKISRCGLTRARGASGDEVFTTRGKAHRMVGAPVLAPQASKQLLLLTEPIRGPGQDLRGATVTPRENNRVPIVPPEWSTFHLRIFGKG